ncbi:2-polyprenyl-6-methoxyphenol hydroxylase [Tenacibaculum sp. MAR_2009_124]|uniref:FAD-dependent monooxygenase n=1 Tax=Tenacibaculum sp. MAR_2009_124 TaxID=1250059 RepID=UPI000899215C|nr:FAD-dependent monooxygenase [Tenacibaculum sp. MAR_2009_124]SEC84679.1 2-polyprenyl-6-methoxyphenol hydroxylase [Tenacibaculum sp. MAR_2009_124]
MQHTIIGGGIGGLTLALLLEQKGFTSEIYEQSESFKPIGAGIILAINAMKVYTHLGLHKQIEAAGIELSEMTITKPNFNTLSTSNFSDLKKKFQTKTIAIHRGELQKILLSNLKTTKIHLNYKLISIKKQNNTYELHFENGEIIHRKILFGADGIHSKVRNYLFPNSNLRDSKQWCWRGVTSFKTTPYIKNSLIEAWGKDVRFGFVPINEEYIYWYALKTMSSTKEQTFDFNTMFQSFNPLVIELIESTPKNTIHFSHIEDLFPIKQWYKNSICLLGDAAHAATPNMGQGACQAIEDAYVLSETLNPDNIQQSFSKFQKQRYAKANSIVKISWKLGKLAHISNSFSIMLRNSFLKLTPKYINQKQLENIFR